MIMQGFSTSFGVDQTPDRIFAAINYVCGWWSGEITGDTNKPGSAFTYRYENRHKSKQKITEFVPGEKVAGHVTEAELTFAKDKKESIGTDIVFEIAKKGGKNSHASRM